MSLDPREWQEVRGLIQERETNQELVAALLEVAGAVTAKAEEIRAASKRPPGRPRKDA